MPPKRSKEKPEGLPAEDVLDEVHRDNQEEYDAQVAARSQAEEIAKRAEAMAERSEDAKKRVEKENEELRARLKAVESQVG